MNRNRLFFIGLIALMLGAFVSLLVYKNLQKPGAAVVASEGVVVAADDIQVGTKIAASDLRLVQFPAANLPKGYYSKTSQVLGRGAILPISAGEFILPNRLAGENSGYGLPSLIPPGMRAVSVRVNDIVAVAGFVIAGTHVDVLLTGNPGTSSEQQTTTVLENVAVIAAGPKLERNSAGEPQTTTVITLLVSPDDGQKLTLASSQGHIQLALRNPLDTKQESVASVSTNALYRNGPAIVAAPVVHAKSKHTGPAVVTPPPPSVYSVEVIRGSDKKDVKDF
jgi:pilus assembly protein CpaB